MSETVSGYDGFLQRKRLIAPACGSEPEGHLNGHLFPFQRDLVRWSLRKGRAALFCTTGMGKTLMQLDWAQRAAPRTLILAPLAVAQQTIREGEKFGIVATYCRRESEAPASGIAVTNYEMLPHFDPAAFGAVVLDESGILKNFEGKTRAALIAAFRDTPRRLCCTATPAPNDIAEIANHAEFLGLMTRPEMLAAFFVHDDDGWRLKGHARAPFYRWLASWGMSLRRPSDLGYDDAGYDLPPLTIEAEFVATDYLPAGRLFADRLQGVTERAAVRRDTVAARCAAAAAIVGREPHEKWLIWTGLNEESAAMAALLPGSVEVRGTDDPEEKAKALLAFAEGEAPILVTKAGIAGHGLNLQRCARMMFVGLSDSYEQYFQCLRRCWRYGQAREVKAWIVLTDPERVIYDNVLGKEREAIRLGDELVKNIGEFEREELAAHGPSIDYRPAARMTLPAFL